MAFGDYNRDELIDALLRAIGRGWTERDEAVRAAARLLGFQRAGRAINDAFKLAINGAIRRGRLKYTAQRPLTLEERFGGSGRKKKVS